MESQTTEITQLNFRLGSKAIDKSPADIQIAFYDDGVGTSSFVLKRLLGQALGWGLKRNVKELYLNLCRVYDEGDKIFIFGYSRGAFTARILAALIANQGIIREFDDEIHLKRKVEQAYKSFRYEAFVPSILTGIPWLFKYFTKSSTPESSNPKHRHLYDPKSGPLIEMLGVWDTVDAYGAPIDELTRGWDIVVWPLTAKDRNLHPAVGGAYHALALDEQREAFEPMLWNEDGKTFTDGKPASQILEQVWFPGVHSNVGGGNPDDSLAFVSLNWMIAKARMHNLTIEKEIAEQYKIAADINGPLYNNRSGFGNIYRFSPRKVETLCKSEKPGIVNSFRQIIGSSKAEPNEVQIDCPKIHKSVFDRIRNGGDVYAPINLPEHYCVVDDGRKAPLKQPTRQNTERTIETKEQAKDRRLVQSEVWSHVWLQRIIYFVFIVSIILFVSGPYWLSQHSTSEITRSADIFFGSIGDLFKLIPQTIGSIPGLESVGGWANKYDEFPYVFVFGIIFILSLVVLGVTIQNRRQNMMRKHWSHIWDNDTHVAGNRKRRTNLARLLDSYRDIEAKDHTIVTSFADSGSHILRLILEGIAAIFFLILLYFVGWKIYFTVLDGTGYVCPAPTNVERDPATDIIPFDPTVPCTDTGFDLSAGKKYTIEFKVPPNWTDATIDADTYGILKSPSFGMTLAAPLRRHISKDWFQPIGRIGHKFYDRYTAKLKDSDKTVVNPDYVRNPEYCSSITFEARQTGRLYLYLNDAIAPWPFETWTFYENNCEAGFCRKDELAKLRITEEENVGEQTLCK